MSKLQANLISVSKLLLNGSKMQLNYNESIVRVPYGEVISIGLCKETLYEINFTKMHEADAINLEQLWNDDGAFESRHR